MIGYWRYRPVRAMRLPDAVIVMITPAIMGTISRPDAVAEVPEADLQERRQEADRREHPDRPGSCRHRWQSGKTLLVNRCKGRIGSTARRSTRTEEPRIATTVAGRSGRRSAAEFQRGSLLPTPTGDQDQTVVIADHQGDNPEIKWGRAFCGSVASCISGRSAEGDQSDRDVDPEAPTPAGVLGEQPTDQRSGHR